MLPTSVAIQSANYILEQHFEPYEGNKRLNNYWVFLKNNIYHLNHVSRTGLDFSKKIIPLLMG